MDWPFKCYSIWLKSSTHSIATGTYVNNSSAFEDYLSVALLTRDQLMPWVYMTGWRDETWRSGSSDTHAARWCVVHHPLPVLIILSLGVKEEWRQEGGGGGMETSWLTQHPLWTENRWELTPSTQITAKETSAYSCDHFQMGTAVYSNKRRVQGWESKGNTDRSQSRSEENWH